MNGGHRLRRSHSSRRSPRPGFTLVEVLVAVGITALIAAFAVTIVTNVSGFWSRTAGRLSAEAQARYVLDQMTLDLQGALYRDDGKAWLAATIPNAPGNTGMWSTAATTAAAMKPGNANGSLLGTASGALLDARFGIAGTWLRFFTTKRGSNQGTASASAPVAVAYQIVRRPTAHAAAASGVRYLLHRSEVRPAAVSAARSGTLEAGFDIEAVTYGAEAAGTPQQGDPAEICFPTLDSVIAENVVDFGIRMYVHAGNANTGARELVQIFPAAATDMSHVATLPPRIRNPAGNYQACFPEIVDVMIRVLTEDGARLLAGYEAAPQRILPAPGRTPQQYWWDLTEAHSRVFTRRIIINAEAL